MFQMRPGTANGTSSRQNRIHGDSRNERATSVELHRHRPQRLVEAECHVPRLARENREHGGEFRAQHLARRQRQEEHDRHRDEAEDWNRLQNVEDGNEQLLRSLILSSERGVSQREPERKRERGDHAQRGTRRISRQCPHIERDRSHLEPRERFGEMASGRSDEREHTQRQQHGQRVPTRKATGRQSRCSGDGHRHGWAHTNGFRSSVRRLPSGLHTPRHPHPPPRMPTPHRPSSGMKRRAVRQHYALRLQRNCCGTASGCAFRK